MSKPTTFTMTIDPLAAWPGITPNRLLIASGALVGFAGAHIEHTNAHEAMTAMLDFYTFGGELMSPGELNQDTGLHLFPGDPPKPPLVQVGKPGDPEGLRFFIYESAFIAAADGTSWYMARLD